MPRLAQLKAFTNWSIVCGYREDSAEREQSRHLYVYETDYGERRLRLDHRETNPKYHPEEHFDEVVRKHPGEIIMATLAAGAVIYGALKLGNVLRKWLEGDGDS